MSANSFDVCGFFFNAPMTIPFFNFDFAFFPRDVNYALIRMVL